MKKDSISDIRDGVFFCMRTYGDRDFFTVMEWYFFQRVWNCISLCRITVKWRMCISLIAVISNRNS